MPEDLKRAVAIINSAKRESLTTHGAFASRPSKKSRSSYLTALDLQYISPELLNVRNLDPDTYQSGHEVVYIADFAPCLAVISSKQRPRRMALKGSDGRGYQYLLKGHEDLRQDEQVMQLFSLVNTLLSIDTTAPSVNSTSGDTP
ncbi:hypothetical protein DFH07DRAFT_973125 [Mycena maculata]|uniref:PI3K/PI4K catalytic domain-containing protein n=1 Tax=Mycena maculata TaxID=230809 RepID=A0AAD7HF98_9AGAR|nr:hypothetical protein DFH07DRAFT_973125 [Mycena maculata]